MFYLQLQFNMKQKRKIPTSWFYLKGERNKYKQQRCDNPILKIQNIHVKIAANDKKRLEVLQAQFNMKSIKILQKLMR